MRFGLLNGMDIGDITGYMVLNEKMLII